MYFSLSKPTFVICTCNKCRDPKNYSRCRHLMLWKWLGPKNETPVTSSLFQIQLNYILCLVELFGNLYLCDWCTCAYLQCIYVRELGFCPTMKGTLSMCLQIPTYVQGFQYFLTVPVLHYLLLVLFPIKVGKGPATAPYWKAWYVCLEIWFVPQWRAQDWYTKMYMCFPTYVMFRNLDFVPVMGTWLVYMYLHVHCTYIFWGIWICTSDGHMIGISMCLPTYMYVWEFLFCPGCDEHIYNGIHLYIHVQCTYVCTLLYFKSYHWFFTKRPFIIIYS